jgi:hypothetical protein
VFYPGAAICSLYFFWLLAINPWRPLRVLPAGRGWGEWRAERVRHPVAVAAWLLWVATILMLLAVCCSAPLRAKLPALDNPFQGFVSARAK